MKYWFTQAGFDYRPQERAVNEHWVNWAVLTAFLTREGPKTVEEMEALGEHFRGTVRDNWRPYILYVIRRGWLGESRVAA